MLSSRQKVWDKDTAVRVAGPLIFAAEEEQIADQMFSGRRTWTLGFIERLGYREAVDASVSYLRKYNNLPRHIRPKVFYKRGNVEAKLLMRHPAAARKYLDDLKRWLLDKPLAVAFQGKDEPSIQLYELIEALEAQHESVVMPSLAEQAEAHFMEALEKIDGNEARVKRCRAELMDIQRKNYIRKMGAMRWLAKSLEKDALNDVLPYLTHEHWRLQELARELTLGLAKTHGESALIEAFTTADDNPAVGILAILAQTKRKSARELVENAIKHDTPAVRAAAAQTLFCDRRRPVLPQVFALMKRANDKRVLLACEKALLSKPHDTELIDSVRASSLRVASKQRTNASRDFVLVDCAMRRTGKFGRIERRP